MAGHDLPEGFGEPHVFWIRHTHRLVDAMLALAAELDADGDQLAAARLRNVLYLDYDPLVERPPGPRAWPARSPDVASEPGS